VPLAELFDRLGEQGLWVPLIVCEEEPRIERVVAAIKGGALDDLQLPLEAGRLARSLARVVEEADAHGRARQHLVEARWRVARLSRREREVLELLAVGNSNKLIARELSISPRTVEIHRSNMMTKLGAAHAAEAVRLWLQSGLEQTIPEAPRERELEVNRGLALYPDFGRIRGRLPAVVDEDERDSEPEIGRRSKKLG
jgi:FixJ family two-component response regulator